MPRGKKETGLQPLSEIIGERIQYNTNLSVETASLVYNSQDLDLIDAYEKFIFRMHASAKDGKLEAFLRKGAAKPAEPITTEEKGRGGRKPNLTSELYGEAVKKGLTRADLDNTYSFKPRQIGGYSRKHGPLKEE